MKSRTHQLQRIKALLQRKTAIEANILASSKRIENAYTIANRAFQYALSNRLQNMGVEQRP